MSENIAIIHDDQDWLGAYKEIATILKALPGVRHVDLWNEQPYFTHIEYPIPAPAAYLQFNTNEINEKGDQGELMDMNIVVHYYYVDINDSHLGSRNIDNALAFGTALKAIHRALKGKKGTHFSRLTRTGFGFMESPHNGGRIYQQTYRCIITDNTAVAGFETDLGEERAFEIGKGSIPDTDVDDSPLYDLTGLVK